MKYLRSNYYYIFYK